MKKMPKTGPAIGGYVGRCKTSIGPEICQQNANVKVL